MSIPVFGQAITSVAGNGTATYKAGGIIYQSVATTGNVDAGEDDLVSYTLPANTLSKVGDRLHIYLAVSTAANANTKNLKLYFDTNIVATSGAVAMNNQTNIFDAWITMTAVGSQTMSSETARSNINGATLKLGRHIKDKL